MKIIGVLLAALLFLSVQENGVKLSAAAMERTEHHVRYVPDYVQIDYPNGDVPKGTGVCTDVVIRSYRKGLGIDLQKQIHDDMRIHFTSYPSNRIWGLKGPDKNIDHRRTQNMECFLTRQGAKQAITDNPDDYQPGDLVFYGDIGFGHVGIVVERKTEEGVPMVVHNIGAGPQCEDFLFLSRITGHYRWLPE